MANFFKLDENYYINLDRVTYMSAILAWDVKYIEKEPHSNSFGSKSVKTKKFDSEIEAKQFAIMVEGEASEASLRFHFDGDGYTITKNAQAKYEELKQMLKNKQ